MTNDSPVFSPKSEFIALLSIARADAKSRECNVSCTSLPWQRSLGRRSGRTPALPCLPVQASRLYHPELAKVYDFVKERGYRTNVKESQWTLPTRKSGHFNSRFSGLFAPRLTAVTEKGLQAKAFRIDQVFEKGIKVPEEIFLAINIQPHEICPWWDYTIRPIKACT